MTRTTTTRTGLAALAICIAAVLLSGGCTPRAATTPSTSATSAPALPQLGRMSADQKRSQIASSFPIEVPVPEGRVLRGEAQGTVWDYQLETPRSAADAVSWYLTWYPKAEWQLIGDEVAGASRRLKFSKGGYAADITVTADGSDRAKVTAVVGMGQPVLNTQ